MVRSRSRSPRRHRDRERDRERRHTRRSRSRSRDRSHRHRDRASDRGPERRPRRTPTPPRQSEMNDDKSALSNRPPIKEEDLEGLSEEDKQMMLVMGFANFSTTKGKRGNKWGSGDEDDNDGTYY